MPNQIITYHFPTSIHYGAGARKLLADILKEKGHHRPLLVTDKGLAQLPIVTELENELQQAKLASAVFSGIEGNPVKSQVLAGLDAYHTHRADALIALGGGAAMDVTKAIAVTVNHPGDLFEYEDRPGAKAIENPIPFLVTIPTTAGTGSEVGRSAVISDDHTHIKKIIFSPALMPQKVLVDPELTLNLPAGVTATTGMDALTHLVEAYLAKGFQPLCDGIALEGLRLISHSLRGCVSFARNLPNTAEEHLTLRGKMMNAALMGGVAFQKGLGVTHSCAHALSTVCDMHHGLANGILLPYTMNFNRPTCERQFGIMAEIIGFENGLSDEFILWIEDLKADIGIPRYLSEVGVKKNHLDQLVEHAWKDSCHQLNPRPVTPEDLHSIFEAALG